MSYTILSVAYPLTQVGEDAVGGSEQILTSLDRALTHAGHRSLVIAAEGSTVYGTLIPSPAARGKIDEAVRQWACKVHKQLIQDTLAAHSVDLIHMHSLDFHQYFPDQAIPILATLHLPPDWYPASIFRSERKNLYLNCVSFSQQKACPKSPMLLPAVANGVDVARLAGPAVKQNYALALGRICPEKSFHHALDAAKEAGSDLLLAGELISLALHQDYFKQEIAPRLDESRRFLGPVGFNRKKRLLGEARCLLIPSTVQETSSLVAMEALAAGTPVIAYRTGALPEIIEHGRTGYLVSNVREMARAIATVDKLDSEACRQAARQYFSIDKMVERYTQVYRQLISKDSGEMYQGRSARGSAGTSWLVSW
jgi:glycosyltransferase involved in cell wall biosynthesis